MTEVNLSEKLQQDDSENEVPEPLYPLEGEEYAPEEYVPERRLGMQLGGVGAGAERTPLEKRDIGRALGDLQGSFDDLQRSSPEAVDIPIAPLEDSERTQ